MEADTPTTTTVRQARQPPQQRHRSSQAVIYDDDDRIHVDDTTDRDDLDPYNDIDDDDELWEVDDDAAFRTEYDDDDAMREWDGGDDEEDTAVLDDFLDGDDDAMVSIQTLLSNEDDESTRSTSRSNARVIQTGSTWTSEQPWLVSSNRSSHPHTTSITSSSWSQPLLVGLMAVAVWGWYQCGRKASRILRTENRPHSKNDDVENEATTSLEEREGARHHHDDAAVGN